MGSPSRRTPAQARAWKPSAAAAKRLREAPEGPNNEPGDGRRRWMRGEALDRLRMREARGDDIRAFREMLHYTQASFATALGVPLGTLRASRAPWS